MDVVATQKGKFGRMRERGDEFSIESKEQFSKVWMVKADTPEAKAILAETKGSGITSAQIAAEEAAATGKANDKAEIKALRARVAALEEELAGANTSAKDAKPTTDEGDDTKDKGDDAKDVGGEPTDDAPKTRKTRRSRG